MPKLQPGSGQYLHIEFVRDVKRQPERRRLNPKYPRPKPPIPEDLHQHAQDVSQGITEAVQKISQVRQGCGIEPSKLFVLEFNSVNLDLREIFEQRFGAWVVSEYKDKVGNQDRYRFLVQFPTETSRQHLREEIRLYRTESSNVEVLPPSQRKNFCDALQAVRSVSRDERIGVRLREEGFPDVESFYVDVDLWHPGDPLDARKVLSEIRSMCANYGGALTEEVRTSSLLLIKVYGSRQLAEALLELDWVARVDLPPKLSQAYSQMFDEITLPDPVPIPLDDDPLVCVVDSGVVSGHPLLVNWVIEERDFDTGENTTTDNEKETLRLVGYGMCSVDDLTWSKKNQVRLIAMDEVELDKLHIYRVAVPQVFLSTKGKRGITVALAYDPPVQSSRKEYLANTMWIEALHGLTTEEVEIYRSKNAAQDVDVLPPGKEIKLRPPKTDVQWSTLQVRRIKWSRKPKLIIPDGEKEPVLHFVVGCQQRFPTGFDYKQRYGLVVLFWHESEAIELYQALRNRVTLKAARVRLGA